MNLMNLWSISGGNPTPDPERFLPLFCSVLNELFSMKIGQFSIEHFYCEPSGSGLLTMVNLSLFSCMIFIKFSFDASVVL